MTRSASPMAALSAADHTQGDPGAAVTLLEYGDYECPACMQAEPLTHHMIATFGERLCFVFRHFPLVETHPHAERAAEAAEAAAAQGKFWAMHHRLFSHQHRLDMPTLSAHAQALGLDMARFNGEMGDRIYTQRVKEHRLAGERSGVRATPTFYINGTAIDVSFGFQALEDAIHAALTRQ